MPLLVTLTQDRMLPGTEERVGQRATISCRASESVSIIGTNLIHWYQQKPGQPPKLIYNGAKLESGVSARFSDSGSQNRSPFGNQLSFTLTIDPVEEDDAATYYCQQSREYPPTVLQGYHVLTKA